MKFSIGQVSKLFEISKDTLRHYDKIGILKPEVNEKNGYRYYYEDDLEKLDLILETKYLGIPLSEIKETIESEDLKKYKIIVEKHEQSIANQIEELKIKQRYLQEARVVLDKILEFKNEYDISKIKIYDETMTLYGVNFKNIYNGSSYKEFLKNLDESLGFDEKEYFYSYEIFENNHLKKNTNEVYIKENNNNKDLIQKYIKENKIEVIKKYISSKVVSTYFYGNEKDMDKYIIDLNKYFNKNKSTNVYLMYEFILPKKNKNEEYYVKIILEVQK